MLGPWSKRGQTSVCRQKIGSYRKITEIGALVSTATGRNPKLNFRFHPKKNATAQVCVEYLEQLKVTAQGPVVVVWDNLGAHHSKKVRAWIECNPRFSLEYFETYAPELNPNEGSVKIFVSEHLRHHHRRDSGKEMKYAAREHGNHQGRSEHPGGREGYRGVPHQS